jgi:hypothetical protein
MFESLLPFFIFLVIIVFSILRKGKKEGSSAPERLRYAKAPPLSKVIPPKPAALKKAVKRPTVTYEVEKKKTHPLLQKSWQDKGSLKQAFILSEVLKKVDEREIF